MTVEEQLLEYAEVSSGCTNMLVMPPPQACSGTVDFIYQLTQWHFITGFIALLFFLLIFQMIYVIFAPSHH